ncbi:hypothetical protein SASPL_120924 [Salvia splendens]|uniref:beta-ketoacyl-[acyl-carrier-protein] synthase I n=1 Tax=Salvia splendens TaxID=180675 RepID=A0A8X8XRG8_SALSN|nr:hypothetical protein SASPL_120924 [Salvia splendens]
MLLAGESGVTPIDRFDASKSPTRFGGQIRGFHAKGYIDGKSDQRLDDCLRYCIVAGKKALESTDLGGERLDKKSDSNTAQGGGKRRRRRRQGDSEKASADGLGIDELE